jgi:hypothetical protein
MRSTIPVSPTRRKGAGRRPFEAAVRGTPSSVRQRRNFGRC